MTSVVNCINNLGATPVIVSVDLDLVTLAMTYSGSDMITQSFVFNSVTYLKTLTYVGGNLTGSTPFVSQA